ncbi:neurocan core protein-like [Crassostrea angulata]|uniref:neurocan core protein-like n=1 Tax=Magallana angulata TaxID=2784310 RepID=UPI0022B1C311|nr:neurocan core protein-like [Crassostrea angulata]
MLFFLTYRFSWCLFCFQFAPCFCNLHQGFSQLQRGHRLDRSVISSFPEFSFLDCVTECLVSPRCASVNYFKGANFCELNYKKKQTAYTKFTESPGWVYSDKDHWPEELAGTCSKSNCSLNEKCVHTKYTKETLFKCVISDCGLPNRTGIDLSTTKREDAIGIHRRIHASCADGYSQFGSGRLNCQSNGEWKYDIVCKEIWVHYGYHVYRPFKEKKTWNRAKVHCESIGAYLVEIESAEENEWILFNIVNQHLHSEKVWTGGSDQINEKDFIWSNSRNSVNHTQWSPREPNDIGHYENCIEMYASNGMWNDIPCTSMNPFICEKQIN